MRRPNFLLKRRSARTCLGTLLAVLLLLTHDVPAAAPTSGSPPAAAPFTLGTGGEPDSLPGKWYRRIFSEAFRRLNIPLTVVTLPLARLGIAANNGEVDGQPSRLWTYADANPNQIRVNEAIHESRIMLYAFTPAVKSPLPKRVEDLAKGAWRINYRRDVLVCEQLLKPLVPANKLSSLTHTEQGMKMLMVGHTDLYCSFDISVQSELLTPQFKGVTGFIPVIDLQASQSVYPYLHKSRADLAPKLADTLKKMKAEGLIERYFHDSLREMEASQ
jgi:polar amino acid transport system substrate-binding protein